MKSLKSNCYLVNVSRVDELLRLGCLVFEVNIPGDYQYSGDFNTIFFTVSNGTKVYNTQNVNVSKLSERLMTYRVDFECFTESKEFNFGHKFSIPTKCLKDYI